MVAWVATINRFNAGLMTKFQLDSRINLFDDKLNLRELVRGSGDKGKPVSIAMTVDRLSLNNTKKRIHIKKKRLQPPFQVFFSTPYQVLKGIE